ncbi:MAG TPA: hypothetical protein DCZ75_16210 [Geobacter sp.]|nr:hypothetical protein [Geobacter sp.]
MRKTIPVDIKTIILHECGYMCANPACRSIITLDIHHIVQVKDAGGNSADNLLALCPNCHALHHKGIIPKESIRAWKMIQLATSEAFDKASVNMLLLLEKISRLYVSGEGVLACASLVASGLIETTSTMSNIGGGGRFGGGTLAYTLTISEKGKDFVSAWKSGDQGKAIGALPQKH